VDEEFETRRHKGTGKHRENSVTLRVAVTPCFKKITIMIKSLRKRHLQIWTLWAVLIPVGIIVAWLSVPKKVTQELLQEPQTNKGIVVITKGDLNDYSFRILTDSLPESSNTYLEFTQKKELKTPSLLIYQVVTSDEKDLDKQLLLGRIGSKGSQLFALDPRFSNYNVRKWNGYKAKFVLYDFVSKHVIDSILIYSPPFGEIDASNF
jgi:hypothetical protein